jgi:hypothetical protein
MLVFYAYAAVLFLGLAFVAGRRGPQFLKGLRFLILNLLFFLFSVLSLFQNPESGSGLSTILLFAMLSGASCLISSRWFVFKSGPSGIWQIIENSLSGVLIDFKRTNNRYWLQLNGQPKTELLIQQVLPGCVMISFKGAWQSPRAVVFQKLLSKRFSGIFPRITLHS